MIYTTICSGHIWIDEDGRKDIEILSCTSKNDDEGTEIFDDMDHELTHSIEIGDSKDYYFIAIVTAEFVKTETLEYTEHDTEYEVIEIKSFKDITSLQIK